MTSVFAFFFFSSRRRHTRLQGDWSSDVCSSDLSNSSSGQTNCEVRVLRSMPRPVPSGVGSLAGKNPASADRKSTRLNSSHLVISYAVFCLKKKNKRRNNDYVNRDDRRKYLCFRR